MDFIEKYKKNIEGLADYNNVDLGTAKEMLISNLTGGADEVFGGGGVLDFNIASADYEKSKTEKKKSKDRNTIYFTDENVFNGLGEGAKIIKETFTQPAGISAEVDPDDVPPPFNLGEFLSGLVPELEGMKNIKYITIAVVGVLVMAIITNFMRVVTGR